MLVIRVVIEFTVYLFITELFNIYYFKKHFPKFFKVILIFYGSREGPSEKKKRNREKRIQIEKKEKKSERKKVNREKRKEIRKKEIKSIKKRKQIAKKKESTKTEKAESFRKVSV